MAEQKDEKLRYSFKHFRAGTCSGFDYGAQFVTEATKRVVRFSIGDVALAQCGDLHKFEAISQDMWDAVPMDRDDVQNFGIEPVWTVSVRTEILRASARQLLVELGHDLGRLVEP